MKRKPKLTTEKFDALLKEKIGEYEKDEIKLGGFVTLTTLPMEAPWLSAFGACLVMVTDVRRNKKGVVEFQLGDENATPYEDGEAWCTADKFFDEWPQ